MFYSHQLLARKAPLGQIWMAATMHAKMNRKKLDQIDIIRICEEILNPSVPMALRLSGILMGGVVIVYERKVRLLYDDVNRLLVEINSAWKVKPVVDPTVLPKSKNQAKFEAVTLPENADLGDVEQTIDYSNKFTNSATFQQTAYFAMRLDTIDELAESFREKEPNEGHHQAEPANITLDDPFDSYQVGSGLYNRFERFDIEGDEETQNNFPFQGHTEIPPAAVNSPPPEREPQKDDNSKSPSRENDIPEHPAEQANLPSPHLKEAGQQPQRRLQKRKPGRKNARGSPLLMDIEQTMLPSNIYQTWLQDTSDIQFKRPKIVEHDKAKSAVKVAKLLDLPPVALSCGLVGKYCEVYYPQPLLDLWMTSMQPRQDSPSGRTNSPHPPEPSSSSPLPGQDYRDPPEIPMGGFGNGVTSERLASRERLRSNLATGVELPINEFNLMSNGVGMTNQNAAVTNSGTSVPSPGPGLDFMSNTSDSSGRLMKKRPSSTKMNTAGLESLDEENQWIHDAAEHNLPSFGEQPQPRFKMPRHSRHGPTPDHELLIETGITQTQCVAVDEEAEMMANNISTHLKSYFETPGAPQTESLDQLAFGMNRKQAAQLFYQTCDQLRALQF
ncbi:sister chromatid cohesion 1 protein 1 isoform X2 [Spinacia oleracea]|uniref:Sister chromatid cohesion 1 protein 1 isoform X2 n=1 Tax=Spinacia oleracea TaxID=3562 RepID=A0ABM3R5C4_SPIOL|nr:sister chromatid cohesion 1 protein 1 isoform X2 [Spinacia oleracea]